MIKCNVTVCGTVSKAATCRTNKEGKAFVSFAMNVVIPAKSGINKTIEVSVIKDGTLTEVGSCNIGERIEVAGVLVPRKWGDVLYFNLSASSISHQPDEAEDCAARWARALRTRRTRMVCRTASSPLSAQRKYRTDLNTSG